MSDHTRADEGEGREPTFQTDEATRVLIADLERELGAKGTADVFREALAIAREAGQTGEHSGFSGAGVRSVIGSRKDIDLVQRWCQQAGTIPYLQERIKTAEAEVVRLTAENDHLRVSLANSGGPCPYCTLPKEDWSKCASGFPGCGRADDAMLCPNVGASLEAEAEVARLTAALAEAERERDALLDRCSRAALGASYGAPSSWPGDYPRGWRHPPCWDEDRKPTPDEAAWHDNGVRDAWFAIRALRAPGGADAP